MQQDIETLFNGKRVAKVEVERLIQLVGGMRATKRNRQKVEKLLGQQQIRYEPRTLPNSIHKKVTLYRGVTKAQEIKEAPAVKFENLQEAATEKTTGVVISLNLNIEQYEALSQLMRSVRVLEPLFTGK
ncbi:MAG: hypothetical protein J0L97_05980 [Alphaproteobacteria bacterium]|nr:hypothetical protein [Alphaproteobacteria bacterium]